MNFKKRRGEQKMKFDIKNYSGKYVMHCKDQDELDNFTDYLRANRMAGSHPVYGIGMGICFYGNNVYYFNCDKGIATWSSIKDALKNGYKILEWSDFMEVYRFTKADLRTGDVVLRRNGNVEIVNLELKMFIRPAGWSDFDGICEDLTACSGSTNWDIVAVRRPLDKEDCQFNAFDNNCGILKYERTDEIEEMTLAEVCKALGKNIKIIK